MRVGSLLRSFIPRLTTVITRLPPAIQTSPLSSRPEFRCLSGTEWRDLLNLGSNSERLSPCGGKGVSKEIPLLRAVPRARRSLDFGAFANAMAPALGMTVGRHGMTGGRMTGVGKGWDDGLWPHRDGVKTLSLSKP